MLNDTSLSREPDAAAAELPAKRLLIVRLDAGERALARLANLMAKLDIEPAWMQIEKSGCGVVLNVCIDMGADAASIERLTLRLSGMVTVRAVTLEEVA